ncbi:peptidoglycan glycosyltransferase [Faecalicatena fissicatena]|uniref:Peptidoglycan glycosyltransferase n=1 Tax=Faecalicatena fissicatena TaxID=290055 RepID=A0ABX2H1S6_9FIRM|nr:penicillin-binding transpeptidase domain-containing protein [Faecalicatena fissicatena]MCB5867427.1 peptidoglycan glycosyltransferase [Faecalicatena fissicatena]NSD83656.1 peptidoglycan glycosyltransferase [Faecalicatena fissicatena]NSE56192.1 peptidoglycan glycosyltransferase [Faecalicatena fissicatena]NSE64994.1 peptidoglycan glycosyltransferase [Faecalicatena fissicatena]NSG31179.1 peptidoglycan glycosyltransferase [Faecalicatena fissicatena]
MAAMLFLIGRLGYLMLLRADYYSEKAQDLHERERSIKAARGKILDCNGKVLADNKTVCTISVIHSQIKEPEKVIDVLTEELGLERDQVKKRVEKNSSIERIKTNVDKQTGDKIREYDLAGVKVDEDYKRNYPYGNLASKVLGFTGSDNQGIVGLEVKYESILKGTDGQILTMTDARGVELSDTGEGRKEPVSGKNLILSLDANLQEYAQQAAYQALEQKQADSVSIILMRPGNGEILAMVNVPEYDLNDPFNLKKSTNGMSQQEIQDERNKMWRNGCINDTYEPGSTFKIITASAALEEGVVTPEDTFSCPGFRIVDDRRIRCHKTTGHGSETFVQGVMNSCNPVFIEVGQRLGTDAFYRYFQQFGLLEKTGIDLPGEAGTIMHQKKDIGPVELATISFGQSFQITPIRLAATVCSLINGGHQITPHFGVEVREDDGTLLETLSYKEGKQIVSEQVSKTMRTILEKVVSEGGGKKAYIEGYHIGGKTATSETLPRSANKYISSFLGFVPAEDPRILGICIINNPQGVYYGGTICAPVMRTVFENILPYLGIEKEAAQETDAIRTMD